MALAIVGGLLISVIELVNYHLWVIDRQEGRAVAMMLGKEKLRELEAAPVLAVEEKGRFGPPYADYEYEARIADSPVPALKLLVLTVKKGIDPVTLKMFLRR